MSMKDKDHSSSVKKLIESCVSITGGAVGGAIGFLVGGPFGAAAGGAAGNAAGEALKHIGDEVSRRALAPREKIKVGSVLALTAASISKRIDAGETIRNDGFFEKDILGRSGAEEFAESVLTKAQREPEERKLPYMANLLSNTSFDESISAEFAQQLSKVAEQLSYRQLCLIHLSDKSKTLSLRDTSYRDVQSFDKELRQILYEIMDLFLRGLIHNAPTHPLVVQDITPKNLGVHGLGADLGNLMKLWEIPDAELIPLAKILSE